MCSHRGFYITYRSMHLFAVLQTKSFLESIGSVFEMLIWSILLIEFDLKWCIHQSRSLFSNIIIKPILLIFNLVPYLTIAYFKITLPKQKMNK